MPISSLYQRAVAVSALLLAACHASQTSEIRTSVKGSGDPAIQDPVAAHIQWWRTFADGDTAALQLRSSSVVALTLSNGRSFDHSSMLAESQRFAGLPHPTLHWSDTVVVHSSDGKVAIVAGRLRETDARGTTYNRVLTVLERASNSPAGWRMLAAQGTREPQRYVRLSIAEAGDLGAYAGQYRVPNGVLRITVVDSALALTDPRGVVTRLEPVGPGLFEAVPPAPVTDVVRLLFTRDQTGRITALSRLAASGLTTFPRLQY